MDASDQRRWRIGELAGLTGLTVRALRHYDQLGLFLALNSIAVMTASALIA